MDVNIVRERPEVHICCVFKCQTLIRFVVQVLSRSEMRTREPINAWYADVSKLVSVCKDPAVGGWFLSGAGTLECKSKVT